MDIKFQVALDNPTATTTLRRDTVVKRKTHIQKIPKIFCTEKKVWLYKLS